MSHTHEHTTHKSGLTAAFWLNLLFSIIEVGGGIFTNSTAIIADAFHDFTDAIAIGIAVLMEKISDKKRTPQFSYGYKRFSLLAALGMSLFLLSGAVWMAVSAFNSFSAPKEINSMGMLWLSLLGIAVNGFAFLRIKKGGEQEHHHHGHSHSHNHNSKVIMLHFLEDVLGWAAVLTGSVVIYFTGWYWVDSVLALMIAVFIGFNASKNLMATIKVLLQSVPESIDITQLKNDLQRLDGVTDIHDIHVWSLDGSYNIGSLHAVTDKEGEGVRNAIIYLMEKHHIQHSTVQLEREMSRCKLVNC